MFVLFCQLYCSSYYICTYAIVLLFIVFRFCIGLILTRWDGFVFVLFLLLVFVLFLFVSSVFFVLHLTSCFFFQVPVDHAVVLRERGVEVRMEFGGTEIAVSCYKQHDGDKLLDAKVSCLRHAVRCCVLCAAIGVLLCCVLCTACGGGLCANRCVVCCVRESVCSILCAVCGMRLCAVHGNRCALCCVISVCFVLCAWCVLCPTVYGIRCAVHVILTLYFSAILTLRTRDSSRKNSLINRL